MRRVLSIISFLTLALMAACSTQQPSEPAHGGPVPVFKQVDKSLVLDSKGSGQKYVYPAPDPNCSLVDVTNARKLDVGNDGMCHVWINDDVCAHPLKPSDKFACDGKICGNDDDCNDNNADTIDKCVTTAKSKPNGTCINGSKSCTVSKGKCKGYGQLMPDSTGKLQCNGVVDESTKSDESCNGVDDDCDGETDETDPNRGKACDGADSDKCMNGKVVCKANGSGEECSAETKSDIKELCNGADDDCDGVADEDFTDLLA